jgi:hypothetical protein
MSRELARSLSCGYARCFCDPEWERAGSGSPNCAGDRWDVHHRVRFVEWQRGRDGSGTVNEDRDCPLKTKRLVVGQLTICRGRCCGNVERGLPEVPVEWLKSEWRKRRLLKRVQLTISGCVGPCDVPNVVVITSSLGTEWLGNIVEFDQYRSLVEWALRCRDAGEMLALPREFHRCRISPFGS